MSDDILTSDSEFVRLLVGLLDGTLDADGHARMRTLLRDDRNRYAYFDFMRMHAMLQWRYGQPSAEPMRSETESLLLEVLEQEQSARARQAEQDAARSAGSADDDLPFAFACPREPLTPVRHIVIPRWLVYGGVAALIAVALLLLISTQQNDNAVAPTEIAAVNAVPVAEMSDQVNARWAQEPWPDKSIYPGVEYHLLEGLARIDLHSKAQAVIEGPARFTIDSDRSMRLHSGRLVGYCPPAAAGFVVRTPSARIVDRGTEFGVAVEPQGDTQTHVFAGSVEVSVGPDGVQTSVLVLADNAVRVDAAQRVIRPIPPASHQFVRTEEFASLAQTEPNSVERRWLDYRRWLQRQPELLALYAFEEDDAQANQLRNLALDTTIADALVEGGVWVPGRFDNKRALAFHQASGGARVNLYGPYKHLTVSTWVFLDPLPEIILANDLSGILMSDGNADQTPDRVHFQLQALNKSDWRASFGYFDPQRRVVSARSDPKTSRLLNGRWCHIAAVFDADNRTLDVYIDGEHAGQKETGWRGITIGEATIGAWRVIEGQPDLVQRAFHGRIDELAVFQSAFTAEQVRELYLLGRPGDVSADDASYEPPAMNHHDSQ